MSKKIVFLIVVLFAIAVIAEDAMPPLPALPPGIFAPGDSGDSGDSSSSDDSSGSGDSSSSNDSSGSGDSSSSNDANDDTSLINSNSQDSNAGSTVLTNPDSVKIQQLDSKLKNTQSDLKATNTKLEKAVKDLDALETAMQELEPKLEQPSDIEPKVPIGVLLLSIAALLMAMSSVGYMFYINKRLTKAPVEPAPAPKPKANPALVTYFKQNMGGQFTADQLKSSLVSQGYLAADVDAALNEALMG